MYTSRIMKRPRTLATALGLFLTVCMAQTVLTNDAILKMAKAGLGEDILLSTIKGQAGHYTTTPDDLIALIGAGVSDKVFAAMMEKAASSGGAHEAPVWCSTRSTPNRKLGRSYPCGTIAVK